MRMNLLGPTNTNSSMHLLENEYQSEDAFELDDCFDSIY